MPEMPDVVSGEPVESDWGNDVRDRTAQRYADQAARDAEHPLAAPGDIAFIEDISSFQVFSSGGWGAIFSAAIGSLTHPAFNFFGDPDTGIRRIAGNTLGLVAGGIDRLKVSSAGAQNPAYGSAEDQLRNIHLSNPIPDPSAGLVGDMAMVVENSADRGIWYKTNSTTWIKLAGN